MDNAEKKECVERFLVNNHEMEILADRLNSFNLFDVLGIANYEIRHSNTLAWLFLPSESHGFDDRVVKRFFF